MRLNTTRIQTQKLTYSFSLEKSIAMLILPHTELAASIEQELQENPLLEAEFDDTKADMERMTALLSLSSSNIPGSDAEEEREYESSSVENMMTLEDHLFQQLYWEISDPKKEKKSGILLLGIWIKTVFCI